MGVGFDQLGKRGRGVGRGGGPWRGALGGRKSWGELAIEVKAALLQTAARLRKPESRERICRRLEAMEASSSASSDMAPPRAHRFLLVGT
jgi:hypothetical protein